MKPVQPNRGMYDSTTGLDKAKPGSPYTLLMSVEHPKRDERQNQHAIRYWFGFEYDYTDISACTTTGGISGGAGATVVFPALPANARILNVIHETLSAWVNSAATQDIDQVALGATSMIADTGIDASAGIVAAPPFTLAEGTPNAPTFVFPIKLAAATSPKVYFAGANGVTYTAGAGILWVEVISYLDK